MSEPQPLVTIDGEMKHTVLFDEGVMVMYGVVNTVICYTTKQ